MLHSHVAELHAFHVAAKHESFTRAARQLQLTQPALSQKIKRLEALVGARLFVRKYRGIALTDSGQQLREATRSAFEQLERNFGQVLESRERKRVRISTDFAFASHWLMSRLPQLRHAFDDLDLQVLTSQQAEETSGIAIDLTITLTERPEPSGDRRLLFREQVVAVCSPDLAVRYGPFAHPRQLQSAPLLNLSSPPNAPWHSWSSWFAALGVEDRPQDAGRTSLSNYTLVLQCAVEGQGIALGWLGLVDSFLDSGQLQMACDGMVSSDRAYVMACDKDAPQHVRSVFDWIGAHCPQHRN